MILGYRAGDKEQRLEKPLQWGQQEEEEAKLSTSTIVTWHYSGSCGPLYNHAPQVEGD
jgi:hypothetical protein